MEIFVLVAGVVFGLILLFLSGSSKEDKDEKHNKDDYRIRMDEDDWKN